MITFFAKASSSLSKKTPTFSRKFSAKIFKNHNIGPRKISAFRQSASLKSACRKKHSTEQARSKKVRASSSLQVSELESDSRNRTLLLPDRGPLATGMFQRRPTA
jgi:hypothetical protein